MRLIKKDLDSGSMYSDSHAPSEYGNKIYTLYIGCKYIVGVRELRELKLSVLVYVNVT